jgi:hypothetical protein
MDTKEEDGGEVVKRDRRGGTSGPRVFVASGGGASCSSRLSPRRNRAETDGYGRGRGSGVAHLPTAEACTS